MGQLNLNIYNNTNTYTLDVQKGNEYVIQLTGDATLLNFKVYDQSNNLVTNGTEGAIYDYAIFQPNVSGTYLIVVGGRSGINYFANYNLNVSRNPVQIVVDQQSSYDYRLLIESGNQDGVFNVGETVYFDMSVSDPDGISSGPYINWYLKDPNNNTFSSFQRLMIGIRLHLMT